MPRPRASGWVRAKSLSAVADRDERVEPRIGGLVVEAGGDVGR